MTTIYDTNVTPAYARSGALYLGAAAVRAGGMVPGPVTVLVDADPTLAFTGQLNVKHGVGHLKALYDALGLRVGHLVRFILRGSAVVIV